MSEVQAKVEAIEALIQSGDLPNLIGKLEELTPDDVTTIVTEETVKNPLLTALMLGQEEICIYLIEKGLSGLREGSDIQALRNKEPQRNLWDSAVALPKIQQWMYEIVTGTRQVGGRKPGKPMGLERLCKKGNKAAVDSLLYDVRSMKDAENIEAKFEFRGPVFLSGVFGHEDVVITLINKGFSYDKTYKQVGVPGTNKDGWKVFKTLDVLGKYPKVMQVINDITLGKREHGESFKPRPKQKPAPQKPEDPKVAKNKGLAVELENLIEVNDMSGVEELLESADQDTIWAISSQYKRDPVLQAVQGKQENIAIYLVEKGFSFTTPHYMDNKRHTSVDVAVENNLLTFHKLTQDITSGVRRPGDGLQSQTIDLARELKEKILSGDSREVRKLLDDIYDDDQIKQIENEFPDRDPVVFAIDNREEYIALYLIEKGFNFINCYQWPGQTCDQWCYFEHQCDPCPADYTALILATKKDLPHVISLIQNIQSGARKPGDGLPELQGPHIPNKTPQEKVSDTKGVASADSSRYQTKTFAARQKAEQLGSNHVTKNGDTLMHLAVEEGPPMIHVAVSMGVPVNGQNFDGNTALHLAAQKGKIAAAKALLMSGADISIRNKLGMDPLASSSGTLRKLVEKFKPGLVKALQKTEGAAAIQRLLRLWCNPHSIIKDGKSALQLANSSKAPSKEKLKCLNLFKHNLKTLELVHAVLVEDTQKLKNMLREDRLGNININVRFKDKKGESPLSCAIAQYNLEIVQMLVDTGRCHCNIRVPETEGNDVTIPVIFRALEPDCPVEMWKYLKDHCKQSSEKDQQGNTAVMRAISCGKPASYISEMIKCDGGFCLCDRNKDGLLPRELAEDLGKSDVVQIIDKFMLDSPGTYFLKNLPQNFYGQDNMNITDQNGRTLLDLAVASQKEEDILSIRDYAKFEKLGCKLFKAVCEGDFKTAAKLNTMNFRDKNGYNALHRAVVFGQLQIAEVLITSRPGLKSLGDNCNRYPLHYAYALPEDEGNRFIKLLLRRDAEKIENLVDKDGREAAEYKDLRGGDEIVKMLDDVRNLDPYGKRVDISG